MADLASIFTISAQGSRLALELYKSAATTEGVTDPLCSVAEAVSNFCFTVKQIGALIVENDNLPSDEATSTLEDALDQGKACFEEIQTLTRSSSSNEVQTHEQGIFQLAQVTSARLNYLNAHLNCLSSTVTAIEQTLYTAQIISWTRIESAISPQHSAASIVNQKAQLEVLIIEQQRAYLPALKAHEIWQSIDRQLKEEESTKVVIAFDEKATSPRLVNILHWQDPSLGDLTPSNSQNEWLTRICKSSQSYLEHLLKTWTTLERKRQAEEHERREERRRSQQPTFDTDSEDDAIGDLPSHIGKASDKGRAAPYPRSSGILSPVATPSMPSLPIPNSSPRGSISSAASPVSPRTSGLEIPFSSQPEQMVSPVEADAAMTAKEPGDVGLGIPWTLRTRSHFWRHIDSKISKSNTDSSTDVAYSDRTSWTEILASWVCKEALVESKLRHRQMQKLRQEGEKTVMEPCFRIDHALTFPQVQQLIERTVEIYRRDRLSSPQPPTGRSFADRMEARGPKHFAPPRIPETRRSSVHATPPLGRSSSLHGVPTQGFNTSASSAHLPFPQPTQHPFQNASTTHLYIPPPGATPNLAIPRAQPTHPFSPQPGSPQLPHHFQPGTSYPPFAQAQQDFPPHLYPVRSAPTHSDPPLPPGAEARRSSRQQERHDSMDSSTDDERRHRKYRASGRDKERERSHRHDKERERGHGSDKNMKRLGTLATVGALAGLLEHL
ncbi:hypothetical protein EJ04DRAFT_548442 [Polyplosphaeria fusca]|uniref:Uncharacterized protein n=1 Tax=Polyplosphaeria fusca TaxID=682080 RepID=A0A9P4R979_9PLEO|nr:hypothetical protein EJ04DRAFT_548442 [Polyplosphaeria fusca]